MQVRCSWICFEGWERRWVDTLVVHDVSWLLTRLGVVQMATRVGSRCTHVVYKNGLMSTLTRWRYVSAYVSGAIDRDSSEEFRLLKEPKPLVVGIAWVVECAEQRTRVDEAKFVVNLDLANVAGVNKVCALISL